MSPRGDLLRRAAECYERAEMHTDAARCYRETGLLISAGKAYQRAGDLDHAADCFRAGNEMRAAALLYAELGRPVAAATCWESAGDQLWSGWVLATQTREIHRALRLLSEAGARGVGQRLRRDLGIGVCRARSGQQDGWLERTLLACEANLATVPSDAERELVEDWAVTAAKLVRRADLAARVLAASYRSGTRGAAERWRTWTSDVLGDAFGVPESAESAHSSSAVA